MTIDQDLAGKDHTKRFWRFKTRVFAGLWFLCATSVFMFFAVELGAFASFDLNEIGLLGRTIIFFSNPIASLVGFLFLILLSHLLFRDYVQCGEISLRNGFPDTHTEGAEGVFWRRPRTIIELVLLGCTFFGLCLAIADNIGAVNPSGITGIFRSMFDVLVLPGVFLGSLVTFLGALIVLAFDYINFKLRQTTKFMEKSIGLHLKGKEGVGLDELFDKVRDTNVLAESFASGIVRDYVALRFTKTFAERLESVIKTFAVRHMNGFIPTLRSCRKIFDITTLEVKKKYASKTHPSNNTDSVRDLSDRLNTDGVSVVSIVDWFEIDFAAEVKDGYKDRYGEDHLERWFRVAPTLERRPKGLETLLLEVISPHVLMSVESWGEDDLRKAVQHCRLDYSYPVQTMQRACQLPGTGNSVRAIDWINGPRTDEGEIESVFKALIGEDAYINDPVANLRKKDKEVVGLYKTGRRTFEAAYDKLRWSETSLGTPGYFVTWQSDDNGWRSVFIELSNFFHSPPGTETTEEEKRNAQRKKFKKLREFYPYADETHAKIIDDALKDTPAVGNQALLGCYVADPTVVRAVAKQINDTISAGSKNKGQKIFIMYVASWLYPSERPIFEMQPRYFGDLEWIAFFHRDAVEPHVSLYGVNLSLDGKRSVILNQSGQSSVEPSTLKGGSDSDGANLLTTSDTIMCFWKHEAEDDENEKPLPKKSQQTAQPQQSSPMRAAE